jgi:GT2 family glycosyltransferase
VDQSQNSAGHVSTPVSRVYIVILNWNGWRDTIECLESVLRLDYPDYKVIVCDNASSDDSLERIRSWARGETPAESRNPVLASLVTPPVPKPQPLLEISPGATVQNNDARLVLIQTGANLGFAGGNNVGLRYALQQGDCDFVWLLNNDTVVHADALAQLVNRMQQRPDAGICGSTLLYYHDPSKVQAWGGSVYNKWFARGGHIGKLANAAHLPEPHDVERKMAYVTGASMLVRKSFLEQAGLMDEQYFLYFEELDWAARAKAQFRLAYCPHSIVYHKEGSSIGSHRKTVQQSAMAEFYLTRNRILVTRKRYPYALVTVLFAVSMSAIHRLLNRRGKNFSALVRGGIQGLIAKNQRARKDL